MASDRWTSGRDRTLVLTSLVAMILLAWMLLVPQGAQPDEASHLVRSAAVVRLADGDGVYVLPDRYRVAEPACYAFQPAQPVTCSAVPDRVDGDVPLPTRADDYPPGGHLVFGLAGLLPGPDPVWWGRLAATAISALLVGSALALALRRSALLAAGLLVGLTPMAWSIMTAVNPSAFATAGAAALWVGALTMIGRDRERDDEGAWLLTLGWIAMTLARRDGLVWACLTISVLCVSYGCSPLALGRRLAARRLVPLAAATLVTLVWGVTSSSSSSRWVVVAPLALVGAELIIRSWPRLDRPRRRAWAAGLAAIAVVAWPLVVSLRPGGWDTDLLLAVIAQTDENLVEAVGVLGWLDTPVPGVVVDTWLVVLGALVAAAILSRSWRPAAVVAAATLVTSWTFELVQGNTSGTYWQGRYSLPLLVGVPLVLAYRAGRSADRLVVPVTVASLLFVNVAGWAAARRWGVGHVGSHLPWRWDTPLQPVHPLVLLVVMAGASAALAVAIARPTTARR